MTPWGMGQFSYEDIPFSLREAEPGFEYIPSEPIKLDPFIAKTVEEASTGIDWSKIVGDTLKVGSSVGAGFIKMQMQTQAMESRMKQLQMEQDLAIKQQELLLAGKLARGEMPYEVPGWAIPVAVGAAAVLVFTRFF